MEEGWATAMIIEDDADWDGGIAESMAHAWEGLRNITHDPFASTTANRFIQAETRNLIVVGIYSILDHVWIILRAITC